MKTATTTGTKTVSRIGVRAEQKKSAKPVRNGVHKKPDPNAKLSKMLDELRRESMKAMMQKIEEHGRRNCVLLRLDERQMDTLKICAQYRDGGDVEEYVKGWVMGGVDNDLDMLYHDLRNGVLKEGGAK